MSQAVWRDEAAYRRAADVSGRPIFWDGWVSLALWPGLACPV